MKVTAKEFIDAGWVDMDCGAPYHIETHPIGHDRKIHEGPFRDQRRLLQHLDANEGKDRAALWV